MTDPSPPNWPANSSLDDDPETWETFRENDAEAGFVITENFKRFSQRNDVFSRAQWDETQQSPHVQAFYKASTDPEPRKADGFRQRDFALRNAAWTVADTYINGRMDEGRRDGFTDDLTAYHPKSKTKVTIDDIGEMTREIKKVARLFGADLVGITQYDPRWTYTNRYDFKTKGEKPNPVPDGVRFVIVIGHAMDYEIVRTYPSALAGAAVGQGYSAEAALLHSISQYVRNLGYEAMASMNDTALTIPYAIKAGLGEYGRHNMVITEEFGPRVRFSKIITDIPLHVDRPKAFGVSDFCNSCQNCATACPPKAISFDAPSETVVNRSTIPGVVKWSTDCEKCFRYWTRMRTDCGICMRVCFYNKDFSKWPNRVLRKLAETRARNLVQRFDKWMEFGKRVKPSEWWGTQPTAPEPTPVKDKAIATRKIR